MAIRTEKLEKSYRGNELLTLKGIDLHIQRGEFYGLLGPNGSGKTTFISILTGILSRSSGDAHLCDQPINDHAAAFKQHIGLVPQETALYSTLSLRENLSFFGSMHGFRGNELEQRIKRCTEVVQLGKYSNQAISSFSGGMRQRANIAAGIIHNPDILFLDEPTVGVDPQSRQMIFDCLREFNAAGVTIVYTTHYMEEAEQLCSRIGILDHGNIVTEGSPAELIRQHGCDNLGDLFLKLTGRELRD